MKSIYQFKSLIWLLIVACFLLETGARSGLVLCFGSDGHVALEASDGGVCGTPLTTSGERVLSHGRFESKRRADHCGSCVDFPFFLSSNDDRRAKLNNQTLLVKAPVAVVPSSAFALVSDSSSRTVSFPRPTQNIFLASRRTVVLLI
jgi:hypothetical protein